MGDAGGPIDVSVTTRFADPQSLMSAIGTWIDRGCLRLPAQIKCGPVFQLSLLTAGGETAMRGTAEALRLDGTCTLVRFMSAAHVQSDGDGVWFDLMDADVQLPRSLAPRTVAPRVAQRKDSDWAVGTPQPNGDPPVTLKLPPPRPMAAPEPEPDRVADAVPMPMPLQATVPLTVKPVKPARPATGPVKLPDPPILPVVRAATPPPVPMPVAVKPEPPVPPVPIAPEPRVIIEIEAEPASAPVMIHAPVPVPRLYTAPPIAAPPRVSRAPLYAGAAIAVAGAIVAFSAVMWARSAVERADGRSAPPQSTQEKLQPPPQLPPPQAPPPPQQQQQQVVVAEPAAEPVVEPVVAAEPVAAAPTPSGACTLSVTASATDVQLYVGDVRVGAAPATLTLPCAPADLTFRHLYRRYVEQTRQVTPSAEGAEIHAVMVRPKAMLKVVSKPSGALVSFNGHDAGRTPFMRKVDAYEKVTVTFRAPGMVIERRGVYPKSGTTVVAATLKKQPKAAKKK